MQIISLIGVVGISCLFWIDNELNFLISAPKKLRSRGKDYQYFFSSE